MEDIREFVTDVPREGTGFNWRIKNFYLTLGSALLPPSIEFDVGSKIGLGSKWKMEIKLDTKTRLDLDQRSFKLCVSRVGAEAKHFICTATMKSKNGIPNPNLKTFILNQNTPSAESPRLEGIFRALIGDELVIETLFVLWAPTLVPTADADATFSGGSAALDNYANLLESGDNSDFVIEVKMSDGDEEYKERIPVHKAILSSRSSVFKTMLDTQMQERENGSMVITDLSLECIKIMLMYIYTGELDNGWKNVPGDMVMAADKYNLSSLLDFLNRELHCLCTVANALELRRLAKLHELDIAVRKITLFIMANIDTILD